MRLISSQSFALLAGNLRDRVVSAKHIEINSRHACIWDRDAEEPLPGEPVTDETSISNPPVSVIVYVSAA